MPKKHHKQKTVSREDSSESSRAGRHGRSMGAAEQAGPLVAPEPQQMQAPQRNLPLQPIPMDQENPQQLSQHSPPAEASPQPSASKARMFEAPKIHQNDTGIKVRFPTNKEDGEDAEIDIVAVHGIGALPEKTWTFRHLDPKNANKVIQRVNWLSDETMLPSEFPKARIMTYGYDSVWYGEAPPRQSLDDIATEVLMELVQARENCPDRPIIFIGHCFGGLIIEHAYMRSKLVAEDYPGIYDSITGIIFMGTPHSGTDMVQGKTLAEVFKLIIASTESTQATSFKVQIEDGLLKSVAQDNASLVNAVNDFTRDVKLRKDLAPEIFCFFEQRATPVGRLVGLENTPAEFMVSQRSGCLFGFRNRGMKKDHFQLNKFENAEDKFYQILVVEVRKMVKASGDIMKLRGGSSDKPAQSSKPVVEGHKQKLIPMLPYPVAKGFASRDKILDKINENFEKSPRVCLVGPCGAGKTHVAVEYAAIFYAENPGAKIYWVNASNPADFELSYHGISQQLKLKVASEQKYGLMAGVRDFLKNDDSGNWLMIFDGLVLDEPAQDDKSTQQSLVEYMPTGHVYGGRVLITTRTTAVATKAVNHKYVVELPAQLTKDDASQLIFGGKAPKTPADAENASKIGNILLNSAGALALVFAYKSTGSKTTWKQLHSDVQAAASKSNSAETQKEASPYDHVKNMAGIWEPLFGRLQNDHAKAAYLLQMLSLLDVQGMPLLLLGNYFEKDRSQRDLQLKILTNYDTLEISINKKDARVTPMIRLCVLQTLSGDKAKELSFKEAILELVCEAYPSPTPTPDSPDGLDPVICKVLHPCAMAALQLSVDSAQAQRNRAYLMFKLAAYDSWQRRYDSSTKSLEQCLILCHTHKGNPKDLEEHAENLLKEDKKKLQEPANKSSDKASGQSSQSREHIPPIKQTSEPETVRHVSRAAMASHRRDEESMKSNISHYQDILHWSEAEYGVDHTETACQQYNLALSYDADGQHAQAETLYQAAIATMKRMYGTAQPNPQCLRFQGSLARMYCEQGLFAAAETTLMEVLEGQEQLLGFDHPETLVTRLNAAIVAQELRPDEMAEVAEDIASVLAKQALLLGTEDQATLRTACSLALTYRLIGRATEARDMYKMTLETQTRSLGDRHPDTRKTKLMLHELEEEAKS